MQLSIGAVWFWIFDHYDLVTLLPEPHVWIRLLVGVSFHSFVAIDSARPSIRFYRLGSFVSAQSRALFFSLYQLFGQLPLDAHCHQSNFSSATVISISTTGSLHLFYIVADLAYLCEIPHFLFKARDRAVSRYVVCNKVSS